MGILSVLLKQGASHLLHNPVTTTKEQCLKHLHMHLLHTQTLNFNPLGFVSSAKKKSEKRKT